MSILYAALAGASLITVATTQGIVTLSPSASPPDGASSIISPSFAGFGIEPSNLFSFAGYSTPNELSINLLQNLADYTGTPPHIRLGGNTQDYMHYSSSQTQWTWINNPSSTGQGDYASDSMLIGPNFYKAANRFPKGTPITYGLNLAYEESDWVSQIQTMAQMAVDTFTNVDLVSLEIGNEPDLYLGNSFRTAPWNGQTYTDQWLDRAWRICTKVLQPAGIDCQFFEAAQTASTIGTTFQIDDLDQYGITVDANGTGKPYLSSWNQHDYYYYIGVSTYPLTLYSFMTLSTTKDQFAAWVTQIQQASATPFPYALREMGIVGPIGLGGITNTFGAALWALNFLLYASTLNISSVELFMTDNSNASAWQPIEIDGSAPYVRPVYYGIAAFDQIIGPSCQASTYNLPLGNLPSTYGGRVEAYAVYQDGTLGSIVVINSMMANATESKSSLTVEITLPTQFASQTLYLASLTAEGADSLSGTTWNGISYEQSSDGTPTQVDNTVTSVAIGSDGSVSITVRDSQAMVGSIGVQVGQIQANSNACTSLKGNTSTRTSSSSSASSNAANSLTGSSPSHSPTNGVFRLSGMAFLTFVSSLVTGAFIILV